MEPDKIAHPQPVMRREFHPNEDGCSLEVHASTVQPRSQSAPALHPAAARNLARHRLFRRWSAPQKKEISATTAVPKSIPRSVSAKCKTASALATIGMANPNTTGFKGGTGMMPIDTSAYKRERTRAGSKEPPLYSARDRGAPEIGLFSFAG